MSIIPLSLQIALRFNLRMRGGMVSIISIISTIGISIGVMVLIIVLSAMNGFERELNQRILAVVAHGQIEPVNPPPFLEWHKLIKRIEKLPGIVAATPYINFTSLVEHDEKQQILQIKGVDPAQEIRLSALPYFVKNQAWHNFMADKQQIIIGQGVADNLKVKLGDWLNILISNRNIDKNITQLQYKRINLQVIGIFSLSSQIDNNFAMIPLIDAQHYLNTGKNIDGIAIKVTDIFNANKLVLAAAKVTDRYVFLSSWMDTYGDMYKDIKMIRSIIYLAMMLVILVACFNIVSTLVMAVKDKYADIAILRTLGAKDSLAYGIFLWYGLLVGIYGCIIGAISGAIIAVNLTKLVKMIENLLGYSLLSSNIYFINFLPTELHLQDILIVISTAILLSLLASWYPAQRASSIDPVHILNKK
ncbi:lipoprotein-releasing ABC transporter permease subunit LolE [Candidatus Palibaumannia cicadellinicola]|uniref:Lipoprotein releasing system transmembrane protein n=1 Tax=Candidatus Palibaumannia cicadellinicola TaxID=186490 RepID=A0A0K2BL88_9GAMM|nr:lipoprotein-releasing ABC transporter permease subunit LolE [Candidatus Baumannia cicadellinicola]AKZ65964.1 Lipoprotein releasing system transmembrane protein [Candidatus Baumannia cicadellinicola]